MLKQINKSEYKNIKDGRYLISNKDLNDAKLDISNLNITIVEIKNNKIKYDNTETEVTISADLFFNINDIDYVYYLNTINDMSYSNDDYIVKLKRQIRKLEKQNNKLKGLLKKHNIQTQEEYQIERNKSNTNNKKTKKIEIETKKDYLYGLPIEIIKETDNESYVSITINYQDIIIVKDIAKCHPEDRFVLSIGSFLAKERVNAKFLTEVLTLEI